MTSVLLVLSLLVFSAGLVAWAVHMHGVWTADAARPARSARPMRPAAEPFVQPEAAPAVPTPAVSTPAVTDPFAHVGDPDQKDART